MRFCRIRQGTHGVIYLSLFCLFWLLHRWLSSLATERASQILKERQNSSDDYPNTYLVDSTCALGGDAVGVSALGRLCRRQISRAYKRARQTPIRASLEGLPQGWLSGVALKMLSGAPQAKASGMHLMEFFQRDVRS